MRPLLLLVLATGLAACATVPGAAQVYYPHGDDGEAWPIDGSYNAVADELRIFVNGEIAAQGQLWSASTPRVVSGSYQGHPVRAECIEYKTAFGGTWLVACDVYVDETRAALLTLD